MKYWKGWGPFRFTWERGSIAVDSPDGGDVVLSPLLSLIEGLRMILGDAFLPFACGGLPLKLIILAGANKNRYECP